MKYQQILLSFFFICSLLQLEAQREIIIDIDDALSFRNIREDNNGDYVSVFNTDSVDYNYKGGVVKFNDKFEYQIYFHNNDTAYIEFCDLVVTNNNDYLITGTIGEDCGLGMGNHIIYFVLLDEDLNFIVENFYTLPEEYTNPYIKMLKNVDDRIYVTLDEPSHFLKGTIELSHNAEVILDKMYFNTGSATLHPFPNPNGGLYLFRDHPATPAYGGITAVGSDLTFDTTYIFPRSINGTNYEMGTRGSCKWLNDTTYILYSEANAGNGTSGIVLYKISDKHEFLSTPFIVDRPGFEDIAVNFEGVNWEDPQQIFVVGRMWGSMSHKTDYFVAIINEDFELLGIKSYGGDYNTWIQSVIPAFDNGCLVSGGRKDYLSGNHNNIDGYLAYISAEDIITSAAETTNPYDSDYMLYPNPGNDQLNIQTARRGVILHIFDQTGRMVLQHKLSDEFRNQICTDNLPAGLYYCKLTDKEGFVENIKWLKQ